MADAPMYDPPFADCTMTGGCPAPGVCEQVIHGCGETWRHNRPDTRVVYGARCSWWDSIDKAGATRSGLPGCPHCGSPLFEVATDVEWWAGVDDAEAKGRVGYRAFIEWLRGRCFPTLAAAHAEWEATSEGVATDG